MPAQQSSLGFLSFVAIHQPDQDRAGDVHRTVGPHEDADSQTEGKAVNSFSTDHIQNHHNNEGGEGGEDRSGQRLVE